MSDRVRNYITSLLCAVVASVGLVHLGAPRWEAVAFGVVLFYVYRLHDRLEEGDGR